ncbi:hypothetical protein ACLB1G_03145 [Oxalobacteraceae bacterium A2-2]
MTLKKFSRAASMASAMAIYLAGCGTPVKISPERLASMGVRVGEQYWPGQQKLAAEGYRCFVSGAKREKFDCTKQQGYFPTCLLRVQFVVDDRNLISALRVAEPACMGTP